MTSANDLKFFQDNGYLQLHNVFSADEVDLLARRAAEAADPASPYCVMEKDGRIVRAVYGLHLRDQAFDLLTRDRRGLEPARQLLGSDVYVLQTQLSPKAPLVGDAWEWHQDFLYWSRDDGMPGPDALSVAIFLDDVTEFNGPVFIVPGTHRASMEQETGTVSEGWEKAAQGTRHRIQREAVMRAVNEGGIVSGKGARGSILIFHSMVLHCSPPNLSAHDRTLLFIRYNSMQNALRPIANPRPEWVTSRQPSVVEPIDGSFLAAHAH